MKTKRAARAKPLAATDALAAGGGAPKKRGRPPKAPERRLSDPWDCDEIAVSLEKILLAVEAPTIDAKARLALQRILWRCDHLRRIDKRYAQDGRGTVTLLLRCILESEGNQDAVTEPVIAAIRSNMDEGWVSRGLAFLEVFDSIPFLKTIDTMRSLGLFAEEALGKYLGMIVRNKLHAALGPPEPAIAEPKKAKRAARAWPHEPHTPQ